MAEAPVYKFDIQIVNAEGITPDAIVRTPRVYKPQDLRIASQNTNIICSTSDPAASVVSVVHFILTDFFVLAHRTGLYNRQKVLWESLSKISSAAVNQLKAGFLRRQALPVYDLSFQDHRGRTFIAAHIIDQSLPSGLLSPEKLLREFLKRAERHHGLSGLFICFPEPFPRGVVEKVRKMTGADDPVGRYESLLPEPLAAPLNLIELATSAAERRMDGVAPVRLVHPDLTAGKRIRAASSESCQA